MSEKSDDTRKLLKIFGVAVTDFEDGAAELVRRVQEIGDGTSDELVAALRELLELIAETNGKWRLVTDHLFEAQRQLISSIAQALPE